MSTFLDTSVRFAFKLAIIALSSFVGSLTALFVYVDFRRYVERLLGIE